MEYSIIYYAVVLCGVLSLSTALVKFIVYVDTPRKNRRSMGR